MPRISAARSCRSLKLSWLAMGNPSSLVSVMVARRAFLDDEGCVVSAKPERVRDGDVDFRFPRLVRHVVAVAFGVRGGQVDRRSHHPPLQPTPPPTPLDA